MLKALQQTLLRLNVHAEQTSGIQRLKRFFIGSAALIRSPGRMKQMIDGIKEQQKITAAEHSTWVSPADLEAGRGGPFDACDLRHWLVLAQRAGVPYIPAKEILTLTEDELSKLSGPVNIPNTPATRRLASGLAKELQSGDLDILSSGPTATAEELHERCFDAMDLVPEGYMVRSNRCGGSELKSLAGFGAIGEVIPEVRFGPDLEIGPGWVRLGNRRGVNVSDSRTIDAMVSGPGFLTFVARPWQVSSRYIVSHDPHRHGTQFAGKGVWPAEWRAIIQGGKVVGVASYYGWCDAAHQFTATMALKVRDRAQAIVDEAMRLGAFPRYNEVEMLRDAAWIDHCPGLREALDGDWGRETVSCTLDFIETEEGPMLLEGGPSVSPFGGGHPCAFAGVLGPMLGVVPQISGVAFRVMPHVTLADPSTWADGDRAECILTWEEVEALASSDVTTVE